MTAKATKATKAKAMTAVVFCNFKFLYATSEFSSPAGMLRLELHRMTVGKHARRSDVFICRSFCFQRQDKHGFAVTHKEIPPNYCEESPRAAVPKVQAVDRRLPGSASLKPSLWQRFAGLWQSFAEAKA